MSRRRYLALVVPGSILIALSFMLVAGVGSGAEGPTGTWTSTVPGEGFVDETWPATFHYEAELTLDSLGGQLWVQCSSVDINQPGWESALQAVGKVSIYEVSWSPSGSGIILTINDGMGGSYDLPVAISGTRMTGSGSFVDSSYVTNTWTLDLKKGGGTSTLGIPALAGIAAAAGVGGFLVGFPVSLLPAPHRMGGSILPNNQTVLGTPYAPSQSVVINHEISSMASQRGGVTRPLPNVPRMRMGPGPIQFPNVEMGKITEIRPTNITPTDVLSQRPCPNCGSTLMVTAAGWSCPFCKLAPPGGLNR